MTIAYVLIAFVLGVWVGLGWNAAALRVLFRERDEAIQREGELRTYVSRLIGRIEAWVASVQREEKVE